MLEEFRISGNIEHYLIALRLALGSTSAIEECKSTFEHCDTPFCTTSVERVLQGIYDLRVRAPLARLNPRPAATVDSKAKDAAQALAKHLRAFVDESKRLAEVHDSRYAGYWPAIRLSSVYSALGEHDPGLVIASYLKALTAPDFPWLTIRHERLVEDDALVNHVLGVFLTAAKTWKEPERKRPAKAY